MGVLRFILVVFAVGVIAGIIGLALGATAGFAWERMHRWRRGHRPPTVDEELSPPHSQAGAPRAPRAPPPSLRYERGGVTAREYIALAQHAPADARDVDGVASALERSITIGARDGDKLVAVARVLTDGYRVASLADVVVDPSFRRKGVGREIMNHAFDATPRGSLLIVSSAESATFFMNLGCDRMSAGFVMRRRAPTATG